MQIRYVPLALCILLACNCRGQQHTILASNQYTRLQTAKVKAGAIPTYTVKFEGNQVVRNVSASPLIALPTQCISDGTMYLNMIDPSDPRRQTIVGIGENTTTIFSTASVSDLHEITVLGFSVSPSWLGILLQAKKNNLLLDRHGTQASEPDFYIAQFNLSGSYKGSVKLPWLAQYFALQSFHQEISW